MKPIRGIYSPRMPRRESRRPSGSSGSVGSSGGDFPFIPPLGSSERLFRTYIIEMEESEMLLQQTQRDLRKAQLKNTLLQKENEALERTLDVTSIELELRKGEADYWKKRYEAEWEIRTNLEQEKIEVTNELVNLCQSNKQKGEKVGEIESKSEQTEAKIPAEALLMKMIGKGNL